jgi:methylase of polypeptide subunit release factors
MDQHPNSFPSTRYAKPGQAEPAAALLALSAALRQRGYHFVTVTPATHRSVNARPENFWARDMRGVFGWSRPFTDGALDPDLFQTAHQAGVLAPGNEAGRTRWRPQIRASTLQGEVFLHSAFPTEAPNAVFFGPDTYRFADVVALGLAARSTPIRHAVDIGCGAGAAGILIARAHPQARVILADINPAALAIAAVNAAAAGVPNTACVQSDLFANLPGSFDFIVANPPYLIDPAARLYRHGGGQRGEALSLRILQAALQHLAPGGQLILYTGTAIAHGRDYLREQAAGILAATAWRWTWREVDPDVFGEELGHGAYADADRIAAVVLTVQRPG